MHFTPESHWSSAGNALGAARYAERKGKPVCEKCLNWEKKSTRLALFCGIKQPASFFAPLAADSKAGSGTETKATEASVEDLSKRNITDMGVSREAAVPSISFCRSGGWAPLMEVDAVLLCARRFPWATLASGASSAARAPTPKSTRANGGRLQHTADAPLGLHHFLTLRLPGTRHASSAPNATRRSSNSSRWTHYASRPTCISGSTALSILECIVPRPCTICGVVMLTVWSLWLCGAVAIIVGF